MKKILLILVVFISTSFQTIEPKHDYTLISEVKLYMREDGVVVIIYDGVVSPCFTKEYFNLYYPCSKFEMDKYIEQLKKQLQNTKKQTPQRKMYKI